MTLQVAAVNSKRYRSALEVTAADSATVSPRTQEAKSAGEPRPGTLFVFEGPDGAGKSTLVAEVERALVTEFRQPVTALAFPGSDPGTLGHHVYTLHHHPDQLGVRSIGLNSLQLLHVAAHVDAIETVIRPSISRGEIVLLDRYWWSTWVYGVLDGADLRTLRAMIDVERAHWGNIKPAAVFLLRRPVALVHNSQADQFLDRSNEYARLAETERATTEVVSVENSGSIADTAAAVLNVIREFIKPARNR